jgi:trehalose 6-phosphate phosphatase
MDKSTTATSSPASDLLPPPLPGPGSRWALFLDVDGSLLDFADDPAAVVVPPPLRDLLGRLRSALGGALALVSGRGVASLDALFLQPGWALAGLHGLQLRHADGERRDQPIDASVRAQLRQGAAALVERMDGEVQLEDKGAAIALHCRRHPQRLPALQRAAEVLVASLPGYELQPGSMVVEIKPAGMNKGLAVGELLQRAPFAGRLPVYVGDDLTDEHGFDAAARAGGFGIRVGSRTPTAARFTLPSPAATQDWLLGLLDVLTQGTSAHGPFPAGDTAKPS